MGGSCIIEIIWTKQTMFSIRKYLTFKEMLKVIFPNKKGIIKVKTLMNLVNQGGVSTIRERFSSALSAYLCKVQSQVLQGIPV